MKSPRPRATIFSATAAVVLASALVFAATAGADRQVTVVLNTGVTKSMVISDTDPTDIASLSARFQAAYGSGVKSIVSIQSTSTTTSTSSTTTTTTTTTTPKKPTNKHGKKKSRRKKTKKRAANKVNGVATGALGLPGLTPLGTPDELISNFSVPPFLLPIYQAAGIEYGIPWQVLAAINSIETDYGRNLSVSSAGALGWMQFMPGTWKTYGVDASGDGKADPYNPVDAIFAAARYLKASGGSSDLHAAIFSYNHAEWYVSDVMHRAQLLAGLPDDIVSSLAGLAQAMFPVAGKAAVSTPKKGANVTDVTIKSPPNAPIVAVADGQVVQIRHEKNGTTTLALRDAYGNTFYYRDLTRVAGRYVTRRDRKVNARSLSKELKLKLHGEPSAETISAEQASAPVPSDSRRRLFAHPARPLAYRSGGAEQLAEAYGPADLSDWFTVPVNIPRGEAVVKPLKQGSTVIAGTILGRVEPPVGSPRGQIRFGIRPAGKQAPLIDPRPIIAGWKLLAAASRGPNGARAAALGKAKPTIGQTMLLSNTDLARRVLTDPRVSIYDCGRADIAAGGIDRRVLATLEYLADRGLNPTVSSLHCGHPYLSKSGNVSEHSSGSAVDIAAINGTPILGHQGAGSITDVAVRALLALQGTMHPHQIITLMTYPGTDNTLALSDHDDHIHVGFHPNGSTAAAGSIVASGVSVDGTRWSSLIDRLREVPNPHVTIKPSRFATKAKSHD